MEPGAIYQPCILSGVGRFRLDLTPLLPRRAMARPHWHDVLEINYVRRGRGRYWIDGRAYDIEPHLVFVIPPGVPHRTVPDAGEPHWNVTLRFRPDAVAPLGADALARARAIARDVRRMPVGPFADLWEALFAGLEGEARHAGDEWALAACAKLLDACLLVARCSAAAAAAPEAVCPVRQAEHVRRMMEFIDAHLDEPMTLRRIAQSAALHPNYASALFHSLTGTPLFTHVMARRVERARALLLSTSMPVAAVARRCGFRSTPSFYRSIREAYGATPGMLRQGAAGGRLARPPASRSDPASAEAGGGGA